MLIPQIDPVAHKKNLYGKTTDILSNAKNIQMTVFRQIDPPLILHQGNGLDSIPALGCFLKRPVFRSLPHGVFQRLQQYLLPSFQKQANLLYQFRIPFCGYASTAGCFAPLDLILKTGSFPLLE